MIADSAVGAGVTGATGTKTTQRDAPAAPPKESLAAILEPEELAALHLDDDEDTTDGKQQKGKPESESTRSADVPEKAGGGEPTAGEDGEQEQQEEQEQDVTAAAEAAGDEPEITAEERKQWPPEALQRIHKLSAKRQEEKKWREENEPRLQQLEEQVKAGRPLQITPTQQNPLADVLDEKGLADAERYYTELFNFATRNPDGAEDVPIGYEADGVTPKLKDFSRQEIAEQLVVANAGLKLIPQRAAYIQQRQANDAIARERYPEIYKADAPEAKLRERFLEIMPGLQELTDPELTIARYIRGFKAEIAEIAELEAADGGKNGAKLDGKTVLKPEVAAFLRKQPAKAPGVPTVRSAGSRAGSVSGPATKQEVTKARERALNGGGEEAETDFIQSLTESQRQQGNSAVLA